MTVIIAVLLALLGLVVVLYPFIKERIRSQSPMTRDISPNEDGSLERVNSRERIYEEIRTLQLEHDLGRIDTVEYKERLHGYRMEAAATLKEQELLELDRQLEEEIRAFREYRSADGTAPLCQSCGQPIEPGTEPCPHCGADVSSDKSGAQASE